MSGLKGKHITPQEIAQVVSRLRKGEQLQDIAAETNRRASSLSRCLSTLGYSAQGEIISWRKRPEEFKTLVENYLRAMRLKNPAVPAVPLVAYIQERLSLNGGVPAIARTLSTNLGDSSEVAWERRIQRLLKGEPPSLKQATADRWAIGLGVHPSEIWKEW